MRSLGVTCKQTWDPPPPANTGRDEHTPARRTGRPKDMKRDREAQPVMRVCGGGGASQTSFHFLTDSALHFVGVL